MAGLERARERVNSAENPNIVPEKKDVLSNENGAAEILPQWTLLPQEQIRLLCGVSVDEVQLQFEDVLNLKKHQTCLQEAALLDCFVAGFWWAKEMNFTCQQISFIMAVLQLLLDNINDKQMSFIENFKVLTQTLLATRKSTASVDTDVNPLFNSDQIRSITDYFRIGVFQHYKLYEFLFNHPRDEMLLGMERNVEIFNCTDFAAPLEEGMPADVYFRYIAPPHTTPPDQGLDDRLEKNEEDPGEGKQGKMCETLQGFGAEDVQEVLGEVAKEMLAKLQEDFAERLCIEEETYTARLEGLKHVAYK
ncbi:ciliary-associated calcium-binding coiled-coil protein 1 isoform X1 [Electrophorus electricus]|uniref:ciliary-associated calcium-binding coiled-coil protein 1 isoform X1 n=1 Tax=Electrophorus electricus TaxID=8005 RepID=UPI0015D0B18F|nr:ciliary-associated calcium-binding coiled-coil protein 1 isoform X1 [Electrophorus electricus]